MTDTAQSLHQSDSKPDRKPDTIIVGGGLVGMTTALALAKFGIRSTVLDSATLEDTATAEFDGRATAIASASWRMFQVLGLADRLADVACPINEIRVTEGLEPRHLHFDGREFDGDPLGHMVENRHLRTALIEAGHAEPLIDIHAPVTLGEIERDEYRASVALADGDAVTAPLLIAADGRRSRLREDVGIRIADWRYDQEAVVGMISHERD
ncbi:MAG: FAD-dependent monooxygenase, partial [Pacificimonas sp.]